ncbi:hypothetical protein [Methylobacterium sp. WL19]|uniref:hypothetical protein n=1 Tax=Methylobacterium sp. WL19 TaxID=2603896 RepID=UPI0011C7E8D5|nr:hypothetical protein [Methylobacterium sp. WL19]TXN26857.1 hypothetical protein FV220_13540 [Methylobacterium sp. WL19]
MLTSDSYALRDALQAIQNGDAAKAIEHLNRNFGYVSVDTVAWEASSLLRDGLLVDAATRIERYLDPKFPSVAACDEAYAKAMEARA